MAYFEALSRNQFGGSKERKTTIILANFRPRFESTLSSQSRCGDHLAAAVSLTNSATCDTCALWKSPVVQEIRIRKTKLKGKFTHAKQAFCSYHHIHL